MDFTEVLELQRGTEGMMMEVTASAWCALIEAQHAAWSWGEGGQKNYFEIGTFKGKSACMLAWFSSKYGNQLTVMDPCLDKKTKEFLLGISNVSFIEDRSEFLAMSSFQRANLRSIGFCHIDGMHTFSAVQSDIAACESMLSDFGIMCLDDIFTELYPQVTAAMFDYLALAITDLVPFLVGFNKAYLCRSVAFPYYQAYAEKNLVHALREMGHRVSVIKTDSNSRFDAVALAVEQDSVYFGECFRNIE